MACAWVAHRTRASVEAAARGHGRITRTAVERLLGELRAGRLTAWARVDGKSFPIAPEHWRCTISNICHSLSFMSIRRKSRANGIIASKATVTMVFLPIRTHDCWPKVDNVRFGSKADICAAITHVRFTPESGLLQCTSACPLCAKSRHRATYSITWSARPRRVGGMVRLSALAVLRLTTSSNVVGCTTGRSAGLAPFRIRPA